MISGRAGTVNWQDTFRQANLSQWTNSLLHQGVYPPHRVYNPTKPGKFGELVRWAADAEYRYVYKGNPYTTAPNNDVEAAAAQKGSEQGGESCVGSR